MLALRIFWAAALPHLKYFAKLGGNVCGQVAGIGAVVSLLAMLAFIVTIGSFRLTWLLFALVSPGGAEPIAYAVGLIAFVGCGVGAFAAFGITLET